MSHRPHQGRVCLYLQSGKIPNSLESYYTYFDRISFVPSKCRRRSSQQLTMIIQLSTPSTGPEHGKASRKLSDGTLQSLSGFLYLNCATTTFIRTRSQRPTMTSCSSDPELSPDKKTLKWICDLALTTGSLGITAHKDSLNAITFTLDINTWGPLNHFVRHATRSRSDSNLGYGVNLCNTVSQETLKNLLQQRQLTKQ